MSNNSSFYESLINNDFYEKTANEKEISIKEQLDGLSEAEMEVLAEELNIFVKEAEESATLEDEIIRNNEKEDEEEDEEEYEEEDEKEDEEEDEEEENNEKVVKKEASDESESEEDAIAEEAVRKAKAEADQPEDKDDKTPAKDLEEELAEKAAYEKAESMLKEAGYSTADYVYGYINNERIALDVAEQAEKVAACTDQPIIKVARDIVSEIAYIIEKHS